MKRHAGIAAVALALLATPASAQVGGWLHLAGDPTHQYVRVAHHPELNPDQAITIEAWVRISNVSPCTSIIGKDFTDAYWVGVCGGALKSYFRGSGSSYTIGNVPVGTWTHVAATLNGLVHSHYINGVLAGSQIELASPTASSAEVRVGSDVSWPYTPSGDLDEVRLWNVARSAAQIAAHRNVALQSGTPGLVAVWGFDGNADDAVGGHHASLQNGLTEEDFQAPAPPAGAWLTSSHFADFRFKVRIGGSTNGTAIADSDCQAETLCVAGAIPARAEVLVRIVGPKPNGLLWPNVIKFSTSLIEIWIEQISTGKVEYYYLAGANPDFDRLPGIFDRTGFAP